MRKKLSAIVLIALLFLLVACVKTTEFTVTFDSNGGTSVESVVVKEGDKVPEPSPEPTYDGYSFGGWFDGEVKFEFNDIIIESDLTLVAKWNKLNTDTIPPAFRGAVNGKLPGVEHLKNEEIDFLENVSAIDETSASSDILIEVIDFGGYKKDVPGIYIITIQATDEAGNKSTATKEVVVIDTLERTFNAIVIGEDSVDFKMNTEDALLNSGSYGMNMRDSSDVQIMEKAVFITEWEKAKSDYANNGNVPHLPFGVLVVLDKELNVKLFRLDVGVMAEVSSTGEVTVGAFSQGASEATPGGVFGGNFYERLDDLIPEDGYLLFASSGGDQRGRHFLTRNFFFSGYTSGATTADVFDIDYASLEIELIEGHTEIVPLPDKLSAPVITIEDHVLTWTTVDNAKEYEIYIDGEKVLTTQETSVNMISFELSATPEGEEGYEITMVAITKDMYQWGTSEHSEPKLYVQPDLVELDSPTLTNEETLLKWNEVEYAIGYEVYLNYASKDILISETTDLEYDFAEDVVGLEGFNNFYVIAKGDDNKYLDSEKSTMLPLFHGNVETFVVNGYKTDVMRTNALNYFIRRNVNINEDITGFNSSPRLYLLTDIFEITKEDFAVNANEAFSTIVLLDENGTPKVINNIIAKESWNKDDGWILDENYAANSAQIANLLDHIVEGDMLLIGKNGNNLTIETPNETTDENINARNFLAFVYVNDKVEYDAPANQEGWRAGIANFIDPTNVTFEILEEAIVTKLKINGNEAEINYNLDGAFKHTPSGAAFRSIEYIQVMTKEHFVKDFDEYKGMPGYAANNNVVFFNNGVILVVDNDMKVIQVRSAVGSLFQINGENEVKTTDLGWSNGQDATNGGGLFNGLYEDLDTLIPEGGYVIFAPYYPSDTWAREYAVQNLIYSDYVTGGVTVDQINVDLTNLVIELQ